MNLLMSNFDLTCLMSKTSVGKLNRTVLYVVQQMNLFKYTVLVWDCYSFIT